MLIYLFFLFVAIQRLLELKIAKRNAIYIQSLGGFEVGKDHYSQIVYLHVIFLFSSLFEGLIANQLSSFWFIPFFIFIITQFVRIWAISSLGYFWNTRIFILPNAKPIKKGPYRYLRHPNYLIVMIEFITIPLIFSAYFSAVIFPILNIFVLTKRIKIEEMALSTYNEYDKEMTYTPRFFPKK